MQPNLLSKILLPARKSIIRAACTLLILCSVQLCYAQKVNLKVSNGQLDKVLKEIGKQTGYEVFYQPALLKQAQPVTLALVNVDLQSALAAALRDQPFNYSISNKTIVIVPKDAAKGISKDLINVHGKVVDEDGRPFAGITVRYQNTKRATSTNEQGEYSFVLIDPDAKLVFTGLNIKPLTLDIDGRTELPTVSVASEAINLSEVTVNKGYYTEDQKTTTGDAVTIKAVDIAKSPVTNPLLALQGRVPGLYIQPNSGLPGAMQNVTLRGRNSFLNSSEPLYIINGIPYNSSTLSTVGNFLISGSGSAAAGGLSPLAALNMADIEEITVLKDADATAIYGSRGANGVIIITTKRGKSGKMEASVDVSSALQKYPHFTPMLNTQQYLEMRNEAYKNDGAAIMSYDYDVNGIWDQTRNTNWQKELLGNTAHINNYQASISGGNTNTQYMINGGFRDQSLLFTNSKGMGDRSGSIRANISTTSLNNKLSITLDMGYVNDRNILPLTDLTNAALSLAPDAPALHNAEGSLNWANSTFQNPLAGMLQNNKAVTENLNGNLMIKYNVIQGLDIKTNIGYSKQEMNELAVLPGTSFDPAALTAGYAQRAANVGQSSVRSWIAEPQISYTKPLLGGTFSALAGTTFQQTVNKGYGFNAQGFPSDAQLLNFSIATSKTFFRQSYTDYRYTAAFARLNYNWQNKYIANITARRDGSSNFGPANQFGNFGAVGVAWVFTEEPWMKNLSWLSFGKLRSSYGITGNDKLTSYSYLSTYEYSYYTYGGVTALNPNRLANPSTQWEVNKKLELGIDAGFLNDRINITVNYFINRSGNQLVQYSLPDIAGYPFVNKNLPATIQNKGFEAVLNTTNIRSKSITWRSAFNISIPRNKLTSFPGIETTPYANQYTIGKSLNSLKQYHYLGVDPLTGIYTYQDVNKDGQLNYLDYVNTKEIGQRFFGGFNNSFSYKGLQLDVFFQYVKQTGRAFLYSFGAPGSANNKPVEVLDRWQHPGDAAAIGKFTTGSGSAAGIAFNNYMFGDNTIVDASFIRLKNVALNYTLPLKWRESLHLKNTQLYVTGDNLLTLTKFVGPDPETSGKVLPPMRTIVFGCRVSL